MARDLDERHNPCCPHQTVRSRQRTLPAASDVADQSPPFVVFPASPVMGRRCTELEELRDKDGQDHNIRLTRRDMLKLGAGGAGMFMISAGGLAIPKGFAGGRRWRRWLAVHRGVPDEPADPQAVQRPAQRSRRPCGRRIRRRGTRPADARPQGPGQHRVRARRRTSTRTLRRRRWASISSGRATADGSHASPSYKWLSTTPLVYQIKVQVAAHRSRARGAADQQLRQERRTRPGHEREPAQPAGQHDLRLQRDVPGPADQRGVRARLARALREPPPDNADGNDRMDFGVAELLVPDAPPQRPHRARSPTASRTTPTTASRRSTASRTRRRGSRASWWTSCISATRPAATSVRSSRSSGSTTTSTATPARTSTRAWSA